MPEIEELPQDTNVPGMATASAASPKNKTQNGSVPTEGLPGRVSFSPVVKLRAAKPVVPTGTTDTVGTTRTADLNSKSPHDSSKEPVEEDDGREAHQPTQGTPGDLGEVGLRPQPTPKGPVVLEGRNSGAAGLLKALESSEDSSEEGDAPPPRKKAKTTLNWRGLFQGGNPDTHQPAPGAGWKDLVDMFSSMEDEHEAVVEENDRLRDAKRQAVSKYKNAHDIIVRMSAASPTGGEKQENRGYRKGFKTTAKFGDEEHERIEDFFEQLDSDFNAFSVDSSAPGGARQMKEELIKALGTSVRQEYGRAKDMLEQSDPTATHDYESIKEFLLTRFHRPQSDEELMASWEKLRQLKSESVRAFMLRVDRLLAQMRVALVEPAPKALVFALKRKVNAKVVAAVSQLLGSEEHGSDPVWWRHHLVKAQDKAKEDDVSMNALSADGRGRGRGKGKPVRNRRYGTGKDGRGRGKQGETTKNQFCHDAKHKGREFVKFLYIGDDAPDGAAKLWQARVAHEDGGGSPTDKPALYVHDKLQKFHNSGKLVRGFPKEVCVTCGWTGHNAGTHHKKSTA